MRRSRKPIVIAARASSLARVQAQLVGKALAKLHRGVDVEYRWIESSGDAITTGSLADHGGKGLFTTEIERAVLEGEADLAVHSMKDLPAVETPRLAIAAIPRRADPRDCLIAHSGAATLADLPRGASLGTASPRRAAQVRRVRPDVEVHILRGNVETRLRRVLEDRHFDATLLAAAGLHRLRLKHHAKNLLSTDQLLPAACQGALAIQCRSDDHVALTRCLPLNDPAAATAVHAERGVIAGLGGGCDSPVAVLAQPVPPEQTPARRNADAHWFQLEAKVFSLDGKTCLSASGRCKTAELRHLVKQVVDELNQQGAAELLRR